LERGGGIIMLVDDNEGREFLNKVRSGDIKLGYGINCEFDQHIRFKRNNFTIIAGHANVGKTFWILYYYLCLANNYGLRFCMYMAENEVRSIKRNLIQLWTKTKLEDINEMKYHASLQWVEHHFKFVDHERFYKKNKKAMSHNDILITFKESGLDALVIDPWNSLHSEGNSHQSDYQAATDLRMFCKINNKSIYILAHGVTDALRKVHGKESEYMGHTKPLMAADIEGGGKWVNRADDMMIVHRYTQHETDWMFTDVHVRKVKETETGGKPTFLDSPVRFKFERGLSFTVNSTDPMTGEKQPEQMEIKPIDNSVVEKINNWYETDKNDEEDNLPF